MRVTAIIQARTGSSRLPRKVLKKLRGKTVLAHVIERVKACPLVDEAVVATTDLPQDQVIVDESIHYRAKFFCGSEQDVLARYYHAARAFDAEIVVRITSDCPVFDPTILTEMLGNHLKRTRAGETLDYYSNTLQPTFPLGLSVEIFTASALARAFAEATKDYEREHVTPYLYLHPEKFNTDCFLHNKDLSHYRWTLDTAEDFQLITEIYDRLYQDGRLFLMDEMVTLMREMPHLPLINAHVHQKRLGE